MTALLRCCAAAATMLAVLVATPLDAQTTKKSKQQREAPQVGRESPAPRPRATFLERIEVNIVSIEVVVTDGGKPVTGLTRDDFRLLDDGQEIEISNFFEVGDGQRMGTGSQVGVTDLEATPEQLADTPRAERSYVVVLVDNAFLPPASRRQALTELRRHLETIRGQDNLIMIATKDSEVKVKVPFTNDIAEIDAALDEIEKSGGSGGMARSMERFIATEISTGARPNPNPGFGSSDPAEGESKETMAKILALAEEQAMRVRRTTLVLDHFMSSLAGLPGRKAVLYVANNLPLRPAELLFHTWFEKYPYYASLTGILSAEEGIQQYDTSHDLQRMLSGAATNRITFYPISPDANVLLQGGSAREGGVGGAFSLQNTRLDSNGLDLMARATGGLRAHDVAAIDSMVARLQTDLGNYYSLGFASPHGGDGKAHRVEVEVDRPGLRVRYLKNYRDKHPDEQIREQTLSMLFLDQGHNPLEVWIEVGEPEKEKKNRYIVPLLVKFPLGKLTLIPEAANHVGGISICLIVRDVDGRISQPQIIPVPVSIPNDKMLAASTTAAAWPTKLAVRPGAGQVIAISIRDDVSRISSTLNVKLDVDR